MGLCYLVVSYVPLLRAEPGLAVDGLPAFLRDALDSDVGRAEAVLWARGDDGAPWPVLVMERADEIHEHLMEWSEGDPPAWFRLHVDERSDGYALAVVPRFDRSIERFRLARALHVGQPVPSDATYRIVFKPLAFGGQRTPTTPHSLASGPDAVAKGWRTVAVATAPTDGPLGCPRQ